MGKRGFPPKEINKAEFEGLCKIQCTLEEIATVYGCSVDTIERWIKRTYGRDCSYSGIRERYATFGKISLRRTQFRLAERSVPMAIFLGKQYLDQRDAVREDVSVENLDCLADLLKPESTD